MIPNRVQISTLLHTGFLTMREALAHHPPSCGNGSLNHVGCAILPVHDFMQCSIVPQPIKAPNNNT
jgi:hypothetical protein